MSHEKRDDCEFPSLLWNYLLFPRSGNIRFPWFVQVVAVDVFYDIRLYLIFVWFLTMVYGRRFRQPRVQS